MFFVKRSTVFHRLKVATRTVLSGNLALPPLPGTLVRISSSGEEAISKIEYLNTTGEIVVLSHCVTGVMGIRPVQGSPSFGQSAHIATKTTSLSYFVEDLVKNNTSNESVTQFLVQK